MQLLWVTKSMVTILLAMIVMAAVVAVPPVEAIPRHGWKVFAHGHYKKDENRTLCKITDTRGMHTKKYRFYRPGRLDDRACYDYWNTHGHPGAYGKTKSHGWG